jgi:hypothetical protein
METAYGWDHARQNCLRFKRQYHERDTQTRTFAKLDLDTVFLLIEQAPPVAHAMKVELRGKMNREHWSLVASLHRGGRGDADRPPDEQLHFNLSFKAVTYHVRCRERSNETAYVFDITKG